jgi:hypothetical protein
VTAGPDFSPATDLRKAEPVIIPRADAVSAQELNNESMSCNNNELTLQDYVQ